MYRNVLDLLVSIVDGVGTGTAPAEHKHHPSTSTQANGNAHASSPTCISRRLEVALAVSAAFDTTIVQLAQDLRERAAGISAGGRRRLFASLMDPSIMTRVTSAAFFLDAYEAVTSRLLQAFENTTAGHFDQDFLSEQSSEPHAPQRRSCESEGGNPPTFKGAASWAPPHEQLVSLVERERWIRSKLETLGTHGCLVSSC